MQESTHEWGGGGVEGLGKDQGGGGEPLLAGGIFHGRGGGGYYITRGGGGGGFMVWVMAVHKSLMPDI